MSIRIFITGGTFDKEYNEITGQLFFKDTHMSELLSKGRCKLDVEIRTLMMIDSLEMTEADRNLIAENSESLFPCDCCCSVKDWEIYLDTVGVSSSVGISFWVAHGAFGYFIFNG